jgi:hypothetical protein
MPLDSERPDVRQEGQEACRCGRSKALALEEYGKRLREKGRLVDLGQHDAPYILSASSAKRGKRSTGDHHDNKIRGQVRALSCVVHRLFGRFLDGEVVAIATVALDRDPEITRKSVENWRKGLCPWPESSEPADADPFPKSGGIR